MNSHQRKKVQKQRFVERVARIKADDYDGLFWSPQYIEDQDCKWVDFGFLSKKLPYTYYFCYMTTAKYSFREKVYSKACDLGYDRYPISNFCDDDDDIRGVRQVVIDAEYDRIIAENLEYVQEKTELLNNTFDRVSKTGKVTKAGGYERGVIGVCIVVNKPFIGVADIKKFINDFYEQGEQVGRICDTIIKYSKEELEDIQPLCANALK